MKKKVKFIKKKVRLTLAAGFLMVILAFIYILLIPYPVGNFQQNSKKIEFSWSEGNARKCGSSTGGPTDNAVNTYYPNQYDWTAEIHWNCVYNINDFDGSIMERFKAARDKATDDGGGVIYFPAGTYEFTDNIVLKNGVVIRGENPTSTTAKSAQYELPTKFVFPRYEPRFRGEGTANETAFKKILTNSVNQDSNIGVINIDLNRAGISFVSNIDSGKNRNIVILGVRSNNVADPAPNVPDLTFQEGWMRYSDRFSANIKINAAANVLVANNRLNDAITDSYEQPGYRVRSQPNRTIITYSDGSKVPFDYANHYGILINKAKSEGFTLNADPTTEPGLFRPGIVIRDNWIFHTMRVGIHAAGNSLIIQDNEIRDRTPKQWWTDPSGTKQPRGATTLENRAIDWSGWNVTIARNYYQVYRHQLMDSNYWSVDGEGILIQECCGGTQVNGAVIRQNQGNSYIGFYKIPSLKNVQISDNEISQETDIPAIYVMADTNRGPNSMENVSIENNRINGSILAQASAGGKDNTIANNRGNQRGFISYSCQISVRGNTGFEIKPCTQ